MISDPKRTQTINAATVRFAGDSGDGMQLAGMQFTDVSAMIGNDVATLPDYPAEIRAPAGTVAGVSGFQVNIASQDIYTPGDVVDALIAMNPAAFKANLESVRSGGLIVVNESEFTKVNLRKAGYPEAYNPLDDEPLLNKYKVFRVPITQLTTEALTDSELNAKTVARCKNMFALGVILWLYDRPLDHTVAFLNDFFGERKKMPEVAEANIKALKAGYHFGETAELFTHRYHVDSASMPAGTYRRVTGNEATAIGLIAASKLAGKSLVYCSYPITPASDVLHFLAAQKNFGVKTLQVEDEIAACCAAIGASYAGQIGVTGTSGPGLALKTEATGLAVMTELPLVIVNVQRGGPSTGLPTKTEQSDLLQALYGRNGDCPVIVLAASSPADCFDTAVEAVRLAVTHMTPVLMLTDGYLANGAEPWHVPDPDSLDPIAISHPKATAGDEPFRPYERDDKLARPWALPGTAGLEHRIGGLEKEDGGGGVCYVPENHQVMTDLRRRKVEKVAEFLPELQVEGPASGKLLVIGWGGTYGTILTAVRNAREAGQSVAFVHLRYLNPFPSNLGEILSRYERLLVPELNAGQLLHVLRDHYLVDARGFNKVQGQPFLVEEITQAIDLMLKDGWGDRLTLSPHHHHVEAAT